MLRRLGIRGKFLAALSVPVLVLFTLAGTISMASLDEVRTARTVTQLLGALDKARDLTRALQAEREATLPLLVAADAERADARADLGTVRAATDGAIGAAARAAAGIDLEVLDPVVNRAVTGLQDQLTELDNLRRAVDADQISMRAAFVAYSTVIDRVTKFPQVVADSLDDRRLAGIIGGQTQVMLLVEDYRQEQVLGREVLRGARAVGDLQLLATLFPATTIQQEATTLTVRQLELGERVSVPPLMIGLQTYGNVRTLAESGQQNYLGFITPEQWESLSEEQIGLYSPVLQELRAAAVARAKVVADSALRRAVITIALTLLAATASIMIALAVARQVVNPLRRLTSAAGHVRDELPRLVEQVAIPGQGPDLSLARIPVTSKDEVGQLATAFNEVNATTIQVAQEQAALRASIAEMFVNVARRDQVLLNRQLSFIDALERSEEDPATLADLFRLDHLATRMRRNAESLLVLAGIDTGRRLREPLPVSDVIRTASSEIEHYERIQLDLPVDPHMLGHVALPAAHMLAEILENATVFSEPGTPVQVSTGLDHQDVIITVLDQGLGMTQAELDEANTKMRATSASDVVGAQRLGLFVVGRIAGRLGAQVVLSLGPNGTGTLATVRIPLILFSETSALPVTQPSLPAAQPTQPVPASAGPQPAAQPQQAAQQAAQPWQAPAAPVAPAAPTGPVPALAPALVQDVSPGAVGSVENPAEEVDLQALTDGRTGLGLPRRRSRGADTEAPAPSVSHRELDDAAAAPSIPLAPEADALAGAAAAPLDSAWAPPVVENAAPLVVRRRADEPAADDAPALPSRRPVEPVAVDEPVAAETPAEQVIPTEQVTPTEAEGTSLPVRRPVETGPALPTRRPAAVQPTAPGGLPVRQPAAAQTAQPAAAPTEAPAVETRAAMFSGFRSRRAELAAAAINQVDQEEASRPITGDGAERLAAAAAGAAAFFGRTATPGPGDGPAEDAPMVVPALVEDDADHAVDEQQPSHETAPAPEAEPAPMVIPALAEDDEPTVADEPLFAPGAPAQVVERPTRSGRHAYHPPVEEVTWPPVADQPFAEQTFSEQPDQPMLPTGWGPDAVFPQPWTGEQLAPAGEVAPDPVWSASEEPVAVAAETWAPSFEQTDAPVAEQPWAPSFEQTDAPVADQPWAAPMAEAWAPTSEPQAATAGWEAPAAPQWSAQPEPEPVVAQVAPQAPAAPEVPAETARPWAPTSSLTSRKQVDPVESLAALTASSEPDRKAGARRRWWPFGRKAEQAPESGPVQQELSVASNPAFAAPVAPVQVAPEAPVQPTPVAPARSSAWGPSEAGAHAMPVEPVEPVQAAAPVAPQQPVPSAGGAAAFFPGRPAADAPTWDVPAPRPAPLQPAAPQPAAAQASTGWAPQQEWDAPAEAAWSPQPPTGASNGPLPARSGGVAQTTFTPEPASGSFDDEVTNMLAQRADLAQQALAELSQLSSYRPQAVSGGASATLARRTPGTIPAAPEITTSATKRPDRDANQVRSLLSSFQSGTTRGRQAADTHDDVSHQSTGEGASHAGHEDGPVGGHGDPVAAAPESDLTQRSTSW